MPPLKDDQVLIIAPGSQTTVVQYKLPESFTPPQWRFPTRMFPGEVPGEWEPVRVRKNIKKETRIIPPTIPATDSATANGDHVSSVDVEMGEAPQMDSTDGLPTKPEGDIPASQPETEETTTETYDDDPITLEGAVYPMLEGRIEDWSCFFALLSHINAIVQPFFNTVVLVVAQPCWSARDHELITQYFFENWKIPAFCLMDAALTACYAYGVPTGLVVDIGHDKCDVTAVTEFVVNESGRGVAIAGCGGRGMTKRLQLALETKGFDESMAEQLKKNVICEILPVGVPLPRTDGAVNGSQDVTNPAAAASTGAVDSGSQAKDVDGHRPGQVPRGPGIGTEVGEEGGNGQDDEDNEGVLDVAAIVARDNAAEVLAKREREKAERAAARKGATAEANKAARLRNSEKEKVTFLYEEFIPAEIANGDSIPPSRKRKREIEVGVERFMAAAPPNGTTDGILDIIAGAIHSTVLGVPDISQRSALWDNLIILGNGSRVRGFTTALLSTLASRYTLSPSTATIFTSELPSNFTTPVATPGTNTPIPGQQSHQLHHSGAPGVNPLLVAATRNMMQPNQHLQVPGQPPVVDPNLHLGHRGFSQTPTSIKTVKPPEYFPEWKDPSVSGMEEAAFLGAQVAAKVVFVVDQGASKGFLTRGEYNDLGPAGIHECAM